MNTDDQDWLPPEDEEVPDRLRDKWDKEELKDEFDERRFMACPHCRKMIEEKSFTCLYCGKRVFISSGLLGKLAHYATQGTLGFVIVLILLSMIFFLFIF